MALQTKTDSLAAAAAAVVVPEGALVAVVSDGAAVAAPLYSTCWFAVLAEISAAVFASIRPFSFGTGE